MRAVAKDFLPSTGRMGFERTAKRGLSSHCFVGTDRRIEALSAQCGRLQSSAPARGEQPHYPVDSRQMLCRGSNFNWKRARAPVCQDKRL